MGIVTDGLVGYWNSKQGVDGNVWRNISPPTEGRYNGVIAGAIPTGEGMYFNGSNYVEIKDSDIMTETTYEAYFKPDGFVDSGDGQWSAVISNLNYSQSRGFNLIPRQNMVVVDFGSDVQVPTPGLATGVWNHVAITQKASQFSVFLNGQFIGGFTRNFTQNNGGFIIGRGGLDYYDYRYRGDIAAVRVYTRALTPTEVAQNYAVGAEVGLDSSAERIGAASLTSKGVLNAKGIRLKNSLAYVSGAGSLQATHLTIRNTQVDLQGIGTLTASVADITVVTGYAEFLGRGLFTSTGIRESTNAVHMIGKGVFTVDIGDVTIITASSNMNGAGSIISEGLRIANASVELKGNSVLSTTGQRMAQSAIDLTGQGQFKATAYRVVIADVQLVGKGILQIVDGEPMIGTIRLNAKRELYVYIVAKQDLNINLKAITDLYVHVKAKIESRVYLKAKRELTIHLKGGINVTMQDQKFSMYAGDSKYIKFTIEGIESLTGSTIKWGIRSKKHGGENVLVKSMSDGITIVDNEVQIKLDPSDTEELIGTYYQECELEDAVGNVSTVFVGEVVINRSSI